MKIEIRFTGYWVSGTGLARGRHLDVVTHRDRDRLPAMPMTQVKGQLRETAERLAAADVAGWSHDLVERLFGQRTTTNLPPEGHRQGVLAFRGDARISPAARLYLAENSALKARLFRRIAATRINEHGVADDKTLRAVEAAVPVTLEGEVLWIGREADKMDWVTLIKAACAATVAYGKLKADGYGRAIATLEDGGRP